MKITTQRTLLWTANFAVAAGLILLVIYFAKSASKQAIATERRAVRQEVDAEIRGVRPIRPGGDDDTGAEATDRLQAPFKPDFHYMGYVPPPPAPDKPADVAAPKAPALSGLIEIVMLVAPARDRGENGPIVADEFGKVTLKLKTLPANQNVFVYTEGALIGTGAEGAKDAEATLKRHGGAKLVRIESDAIVAEWAGETVRVDLVGPADAHQLSIVDADGNAIIGSKDGVSASAAAAPAAAPVAAAGEVALFETKDTAAGSELTLTKDGWDRFSNEGENLLEGVEFEKTKDPRTKRDALKIGKIPAGLSRYGIQDGDIILSIDGKQVTSKETIVRHVRGTMRTRSSYNVVLLRDGNKRHVNVNVPKDLNRASTQLPNVQFGGGNKN